MTVTLIDRRRPRRYDDFATCVTGRHTTVLCLISGEANSKLLFRCVDCDRWAVEIAEVETVLRKRYDRLDDAFEPIGRAREGFEVGRLVPTLLEMGDHAAGNPNGECALFREATQPAAEGVGPFLKPQLHRRPENQVVALVHPLADCAGWEQTRC